MHDHMGPEKIRLTLVATRPATREIRACCGPGLPRQKSFARLFAKRTPRPKASYSPYSYERT